MGQLYELDSGGTQGFPGQSHGQNGVCGRRGVVRNQGGGLGPTELAGKPPPRWWCGQVSADAGALAALQVCLGLSGAQHKIAKNIRKLEHEI